jgi:hypothetical protein
LYGSVTTLPWGLRVHDMDRANPGRATVIDGEPVVLPDLYHPTFLYEALWNVGVALLVFLLDRRFKFGRGRAFALYVMAYTAGRFWIEMLRTDEATAFFGIRLNVFTSVLVFLGALLYFLLVKGPRGYVVPVDAPDTVVSDAAPNDISKVDVSMGGERSASAPPPAYQVVSEQRFEAYRRTGVLPPADAPHEDLTPTSAAPTGTTAAAAATTGAATTTDTTSTATTAAAAATTGTAATAVTDGDAAPPADPAQPAETGPAETEPADPQPSPAADGRPAATPARSTDEH